MSEHYTEAHYEKAVLQLFEEQLGYRYIYGPAIARDYHSPLYEELLVDSLQRINYNGPLVKTKMKKR